MILYYCLLSRSISGGFVILCLWRSPWWTYKFLTCFWPNLKICTICNSLGAAIHNKKVIKAKKWPPIIFNSIIWGNVAGLNVRNITVLLYTVENTCTSSKIHKNSMYNTTKSHAITKLLSCWCYYLYYWVGKDHHSLEPHSNQHLRHDLSCCLLDDFGNRWALLLNNGLIK